MGETASTSGTTDIGLRYLPTNAEGVAPGCWCEGWGAADASSGVTGFANADWGIENIRLVNFAIDSTTSGATSAISVVEIGTPATLRVTHDYHPSSTPNLYEVTVTIENVSSATVEPRYRRVVDWDVEPTAYEEYVTISRGSSSALLYSSDNGFEIADPLSQPSAIDAAHENTSFVDSGPDDYGTLFDFGFGSLAPGEQLNFKLYYGAAGTETQALAALSQVGASTYSLGQTKDDPSQGTPNTFILGFKAN